ncbi:hypothetical protein [Evansella tamaricis]|uniref:Uncharacterized protein n=1 Tax=Evansella tamaricis TaxID=2069301 RepID=A0ABS6JRJ9_9BACI|nr:hypothetical protein [Evansella tamaricis]MBU9714923.1 hypothetical protein [Evansella tamaricis]
MNTTGFIRGLMSKNLSNDEFLKCISQTIEHQLQEWHEDYSVFIMKLANYEIVVKRENVYYNVSLSAAELDYLQNRSPYSLDFKIWTELETLGLKITKGPGNYLHYVFS